METIFNWTISAMDCQKQEGELTKIVVTVHWRLSGERDGFTTEIYGATTLNTPTNTENFTAYKDLTKEQVVSWLENTMSVIPTIEEGQEPQVSQLDSLKETVNSKIDLLVNPITELLPPPF